MSKKASVPGVNPRVQAGDCHTLSHTAIVGHGDRTEIASCEINLSVNRLRLSLHIDTQSQNIDKIRPRSLEFKVARNELLSVEIFYGDKLSLSRKYNMQMYTTVMKKPSDYQKTLRKP